MKRGLEGLLAVALLTLIAGAGCGGGGDSGLSAAEFRKQADAICLHQNEAKGRAIAAAYKEPKKLGIKSKGEKGLEEILIQLALPPIVTMTEELGELDAPDSAEGKTEAMVTALEEETKRMKADPASVVSGKAGEFTEANKLAKELGLKDCAEI